MTHEDIAAIPGRHRSFGAVIEIASNMWTPGVTTWQNDHDVSCFAMGALEIEAAKPQPSPGNAALMIAALAAQK